jgi:glycosyltransferase involved in cell wall biosynthesis
MTMGEGSKDLSRVINIPIIDLGYVSGDYLKALIYSTADIFVFPTRADNLPIVIQESMACGTPVVSFNLGGVPELVRHGKTGLLAKPGDPIDLAEKLVNLLEDNTLRNQMELNSREVAVADYSIRLQADRYMALYRQVIENFHG